MSNCLECLFAFKCNITRDFQNATYTINVSLTVEWGPAGGATDSLEDDSHTCPPLAPPLCHSHKYIFTETALVGLIVIYVYIQIRVVKPTVVMDAKRTAIR